MKTLMPAQLSWENKAHQLLVFHKRSSVYTRKNCIGFQVLILMYTYCIMCQSLWLSTSMNPLSKMIGQASPFVGSACQERLQNNAKFLWHHILRTVHLVLL
jgi:hypothetical protein